MLIRLDGTVVTSLPATYVNGRLLSLEQAEKAIEELKKEEEPWQSNPNADADIANSAVCTS